MKRSKRIYVLLGVLVLVCAGIFAAVKLEERQEQIRASEEVIIALAADDVQSLSWSYEETSLGFTRDDDGSWHWNDDTAFPVSQERINALLSIFEVFSVNFVIESVEDYSQYGLAEPVCTVKLSTEEESYTVLLGNYSNLDSRRYVSIGDGNAYLVSNDPLESFELVISDMIEHDKTLNYDTVTSMSFSGTEEWSLSYSEEGQSLCAEDCYFTDELPLDTFRVEDYLGNMSLLTLETYVSYNASETELQTYGLDSPELSITVDYTLGEEEPVAGSYTLHISRSAEQRAMTAQEEDELESWIAYARVGDSGIIYEISSSEFETLIAAGYNDLRHTEVFTADFSSVTSIDITMEGNDYTLTAQTVESEEEDGEPTTLWYYGDTEIAIGDIQIALEELAAAEFTDADTDGQEEISLTLYLSDAQLDIVLYRHDGTNCLAVIDGESFAFIPRSKVVALIEAVNAIVLN